MGFHRRQQFVAVEDIAQTVGPMVQQAVSQQLDDLAQGLQQGKSLREIVPAIAVLTDKQDARNRAIRTFVQNLAIDLAVSLLVVLGTALATLDITSKEAWTALGLLLAKTALSAPVAYVMRLRVKPAAPTTLIPKEG